MEAPAPTFNASPDSPVAPDPKAAKRANYDLYLANVASGSLEATNKPVQLFLEVSSRCNLRCKKCGFAWDPSLAASGKDLPWPILSRMDDFFAAAVEVYTFGYGEMFLYPDLAPLVTVLKNHGCRLSGVTNGVLIRPADVVWLVATGYDHLAFSIDGGTEETMQKLRGASLAKVLRALQLIHEEKQRRKAKLPNIVVNFVAQNDNIRELPDLVRQLSPLGIYFLGVNPLHHFFGIPGPYAPYYEEFRLGKVPRPEFEAIVEESRVAADAAGMVFQNFVNADFEWQEEAHTEAAAVALHNHPSPEAAAEREPAPVPVVDAPVAVAPADAEAPSVPAALPVVKEQALPPMYCHYPWTTLYLSAAGKARVCCYMSIHENLGDFAGDSSVDSAWNGPLLQSVREHIRDGRVHPACSQCVPHRSYEMHAASMNPIRAELGILSPTAAEVVPEPAAQAPLAEEDGALRRLLKRWRKAAPAGDGSSPRP